MISFLEFLKLLKTVADYLVNLVHEQVFLSFELFNLIFQDLQLVYRLLKQVEFYEAERRVNFAVSDRLKISVLEPFSNFAALRKARICFLDPASSEVEVSKDEVSIGHCAAIRPEVPLQNLNVAVVALLGLVEHFEGVKNIATVGKDDLWV